MRELIPGLTIGISSFERPECVERLVRSIRTYYPHTPILIADDSTGEVFDRRIKLLRDQFEDVRVLRCLHDAGLSVKRNTLVDACRTELICLCDDDFVFTERTNLTLLTDAIDAGCDLVAGDVELSAPFCNYFVRRGTVLHEEGGNPSAQPRSTYGGYPLYDLLLNFFVARTAALQSVRWDPVLKMHEHSDWFMRAEHLRKTLVLGCSVGHAREVSPEYSHARRTKIATSREPRLQRLRDRGLTHYVNDGGRVIDLVIRTPAETPAQAAVPLHVRANQANPVGPQDRTSIHALRRPLLPLRSTQRPVRRQSAAAEQQQRGTARCFLGLPAGTRVSPSPDDLPPALRILRGARVLVLGSAPTAVIPPPSTYDVIVTANGGACHVPLASLCPLIAVINASALGLVSDTPSVNHAALATYAGHVLSAVVVLPNGGWRDYHDALAQTWWERAPRDLAALAVARDSLVLGRPLGLTHAGRDRLLASPTNNLLVHGARPLVPATWGWQTSGWSAGVIAACLAYAAGAASICLAGMSSTAGHGHAEPRERGVRAHLVGDHALLRAAVRHDAERWSTTIAEWATATGMTLHPSLQAALSSV